MKEINPVDPRVQHAADEFRQALEELRVAQDPLLKKVLRTRALEKLYQACFITEAVEMQDLLKSPFLSVN